MPFEVAIVEPPEIPTYIGIADKALHLKKLNMNPNQIAVALKVDRPTVLRDLRWVKSIPVHATGPPPQLSRRAAHSSSSLHPRCIFRRRQGMNVENFSPPNIPN